MATAHARDDWAPPRPPPAKRRALYRYTLTETRAMALLVAASAPLLGRLRLVARDSPFQVISSYEWIELDVPDPDHIIGNELEEVDVIPWSLAWVEKARDACVLWHLVASCPDFSGHENPGFWLRLIDRLAQDPENFRVLRREEYVSTLADDDDDSNLDNVVQAGHAYKFFVDENEEELSFPRFRLKLPRTERFDESDDVEDQAFEIRTSAQWFDKVVQVFSGLEDGRARCTGIIQRVVEELFPLVNQERFGSPVAVGVRLTRSYPLDGIAQVLRQLDVRLQEIVPTRTERMKELVAGHLCFPSVTIEELSISTQKNVSDKWELEALTDILDTQLVRIPLVKLTPSEVNVTTTALTRLMIAVGRPQPLKLNGKTTISLFLKDASLRQCEIIFSMLPESVGGAVGTRRSTGTIL